MSPTSGQHEDDELVLRALLALVETEEAIAEHGYDPLAAPDEVAAVARRLRERAASGGTGSPLDRASDTSRPDDLDVEWLILETASRAAIRSTSADPLPEALQALDAPTGARLTLERAPDGRWTVRVSGVAPGRYTVEVGWADTSGTVVTVDVPVERRRSAPVPLDGPATSPSRVRIRPA